MRRQEAALARRDPLPADMKSKIPAITIGLDLGGKKHAICVLNQARLPVSFRSHGPACWQQRLGAAAPNPAKLSQLDRLWISPLNPLRGLLPSRPPGEAGGISFAWSEFQPSI